MVFLIVLLGVALAVSLAFNLGLVGRRASKPAVSLRDPAASSPSAKSIDAAPKREKKEADELRRELASARDEAKASKRKLFEISQGERAHDAQLKERAEAEAHATMQLAATREELAHVTAEVSRLQAALEARGKVRSSAPSPIATATTPAQPVTTKVVRELSGADREKIERLTVQAASDQRRVSSLEREARNLRTKMEAMMREGRRGHAETTLARDKFRAVEARLNRSLLENDLLRRAIADLEKRTGMSAERTSFTAEETAHFDAKMKEKHASEDLAEAQARARLEAAVPEGDTPDAAAEVPPAASAPRPEATPTAAS